MEFKPLFLKSLLLSAVFNYELSAIRDIGDDTISDGVSFVIYYDGKDLQNGPKTIHLQNNSIAAEASKFHLEAKKLFSEPEAQQFLQNLSLLLNAQDTNRIPAVKSAVVTEFQEQIKKTKSPAEQAFLTAILRKSLQLQAQPQFENFLNQVLTVKKSLSGELVQLQQKLLPPSAINKHLDDFVIGQTHAKKVLSVAMYNHYKRASLMNQNKKDKDVEITKSNVLLIGPSGSGKTLLAETLAKALDVPFLMVDASQITATGYVGDSINDVMKRLLHAAGGDPKKAERAIVFIDELDKRKAGSTNGTVDVSGLCVQQELLKLIEGTKIRVPSGQNPMQGGQEVELNTSNILFICGGAFVGLDKLMAERLGVSVGLLDTSDPTHPLRPSSEDLIRFGIIPELIGRLPVIAMLDDITEETLIRILKEPKNAITKQYQELFKMEDVELSFTDEALQAIAKRALDGKIGARGLRSILEEALLETMYLLPDSKNIKKVIVTEDVILDGKAPLIEYKDGNQPEKKAD